MVGLRDTPIPGTAGCFMAVPARGGFGISGLWVRRLLGQRGGIGTAPICEADRPTRVAPRAKCAPGRVANDDELIVVQRGQGARSLAPSGLSGRTGLSSGPWAQSNLKRLERRKCRGSTELTARDQPGY